MSASASDYAALRDAESAMARFESAKKQWVDSIPRTIRQLKNVEDLLKKHMESRDTHKSVNAVLYGASAVAVLYFAAPIAALGLAATGGYSGYKQGQNEEANAQAALTAFEQALQLDDEYSAEFKRLATELNGKLAVLEQLDPEKLEELRNSASQGTPIFTWLVAHGQALNGARATWSGAAAFGNALAAGGEAAVVTSGASIRAGAALSQTFGKGAGTAVTGTRAGAAASPLGAALSVGFAVYSVYDAYSTWNDPGQLKGHLEETIKYYENALKTLRR